MNFMFNDGCLTILPKVSRCMLNERAGVSYRSRIVGTWTLRGWHFVSGIVWPRFKTLCVALVKESMEYSRGLSELLTELDSGSWLNLRHGNLRSSCIVHFLTSIIHRLLYIVVHEQRTKRRIIRRTFSAFLLWIQHFWKYFWESPTMSSFMFVAITFPGLNADSHGKQ